MVLGDGPERSALQALCAELQLDDRVRFIGRVGADEMVAYFRALDVFTLPTEREGFGMVFAEAMAAETPVVAPRLPPMDGIAVDERTGYLVEPGDPAAYAAAILRLLDDPALREEMGREGRDCVFERFDETRSFRAIYATYQDLLRERSIP